MNKIIHLNTVVKSVVYIFFTLILSCETKEVPKDYTVYVNPFIGTQNEGHTFPGATTPLGMVQPSPESYNTHYEGYEMDHIAGYQYNDPWLIGFTQTHLNGVGCPSMSDILLQPLNTDTINSNSRFNYKSTYKKESEVATPGYYKVYLDDFKVQVELTASEHVAYHRYTFDDPENAKLLIDLQYGVSWDINEIPLNILEAHQQFEDDYTLSGYRKARVWAHRDLYYVIKFNKKINSKNKLPSPNAKEEKAPRYILDFEMEDSKTLEVKIGVSTVGIEEAKKNLEAQIPTWNSFDNVRTSTNKKWNDILGKFNLKGDEDKKEAFYTSLYHLYIQPNNIADVDGKFRSSDSGVQQATAGKYYSTLSLWDTYRAANPMYTMLSPDLVSDINTSMLDSYKYMKADSLNPKEANKYLPRWQLWGQETHTMVGNHAVPVLVDAYLKGIKSKGYTDDEIFDAVWTSLTKEHYRNHVKLVDSFGYIPYDVKLSSIDDGRETVSRLLENTYDDYAGALLAEKLGKTEKAKFLRNRASFYKNVYDKESGFMRGKNAKGEFKTDVDVTEVVGEWLEGSDFTEGNAFHYQFHVLHDIPGLVNIMGGKTAFGDKLDAMFYSKEKPEVRTLVWNIHGTYGQYWHGNEPCHHVPYLYKFSDRPHKTDKIIKTLIDEYYYTKPDGLMGNDDCGQMSAWYMFGVLGFYPVNPTGGEYVLGAPQIEEAIINLPNGKTFTMTAKNLSDTNYIVHSVTLNGEVLDREYITHDEILNGGELVFEMTAE
ncbi:glycoside hydrolase family 92 protein [Seonamhaeicola sediminis]|uniref:Glycoside hydrolase family 92 protein n=1 Tax=Seonamhaeicola sediminis TaxID=2528206 RepID=A0A562YIU7_9FLAO|nr:GH92 family glycosyl hydrolase [Seonamhaeicola sediminis]TWO34651.1 glycoside hydrolase family 92 protein [Seonamhaeicola sediminis]